MRETRSQDKNLWSEVIEIRNSANHANARDQVILIKERLLSDNLLSNQLRTGIALLFTFIVLVGGLMERSLNSGS